MSTPKQAKERKQSPSDDDTSISNSGSSRLQHEFFGFQRARTVFAFETDGTLRSRTLSDFEEPIDAVDERIKGYAFTIPLVLNGRKDQDLPLAPGLVLISGHTKAGKSSFVRALARRLPENALIRVTATEPYDEPEEIDTVRTFSTADAALASIVKATLVDGAKKTLFVIDSLRGPLFETNGPAGAKGIVMPFFTQLTRVSNRLARAGITVVATINPMEEDYEFADAFLKKLTASVPTTILVEGREEKSGLERFRGTVIARPLRQAIPFTLTSHQNEQNDVMTSDTFLTEMEFEAPKVFESTFDRKRIVDSIATV